MTKEAEKVETYPDGTVIQRYPKWITLKDEKTKLIVQNKKEHDEALGIKPIEESKKELDTKKSAWGDK